MDDVVIKNRRAMATTMARIMIMARIVRMMTRIMIMVDSEDDGDVETEEMPGDDWTLALEVPQSWAMKKPIIEMVMIMTDMINR